MTHDFLTAPTKLLGAINIFHSKEVINQKIFEQIQLIASENYISSSSVSEIVKLTAQITYELGDYYELFTAFEVAFRKSLRIFDIEQTYLRGRGDRKKGVSLHEGLRAYQSEVLTGAHASKIVEEMQILFNQVANRLKNRVLLAEFVAEYRNFSTTDKYVDVFYRAGYQTLKKTQNRPNQF